MEQNTSQSSNDIKNRILHVAIELFADKGFEGASVRDIAKQAHVNIAMVSYYFGSKEGLYLECIANFAKGKVEHLKQTLGTPNTVEEFKLRFRMMVDSKMKAYTEDLGTHKIIMREMQTERDAEFHKKFVDQLEPIFRTIQGFFKLGIDKGFLKPHVNSELLALMLMGIMSQPCISDKSMKMRLGYCMADEPIRDQYVEQICELFYAGVLK